MGALSIFSHFLSTISLKILRIYPTISFSHGSQLHNQLFLLALSFPISSPYWLPASQSALQIGSFLHNHLFLLALCFPISIPNWLLASQSVLPIGSFLHNHFFLLAPSFTSSSSYWLKASQSPLSIDSWLHNQLVLLAHSFTITSSYWLPASQALSIDIRPKVCNIFDFHRLLGLSYSIFSTNGKYVLYFLISILGRPRQSTVYTFKIHIFLTLTIFIFHLNY